MVIWASLLLVVYTSTNFISHKLRLHVAIAMASPFQHLTMHLFRWNWIFKPINNLTYQDQINMQFGYVKHILYTNLDEITLQDCFHNNWSHFHSLDDIVIKIQITWSDYLIRVKCGLMWSYVLRDSNIVVSVICIFYLFSFVTIETQFYALTQISVVTFSLSQHGGIFAFVLSLWQHPHLGDLFPCVLTSRASNMPSHSSS